MSTLSGKHPNSPLPIIWLSVQRIPLRFRPMRPAMPSFPPLFPRAMSATVGSTQTATRCPQ